MTPARKLTLTSAKEIPFPPNRQREMNLERIILPFRVATRGTDPR
jgi:hypothetical protein